MSLCSSPESQLVPGNLWGDRRVTSASSGLELCLSGRGHAQNPGFLVRRTGMAGHTCNPSTGEVEAEEPKVQDQSWLTSSEEAGLQEMLCLSICLSVCQYIQRIEF